MYAVVHRYHGVTNPEDVAGRVNAAVASTGIEACGLVAYWALDAGDGIMASVGILDDRSCAETFRDPALAWLRDDITTFVPHPPEVTAGEVFAALGAGVVQP
jgi:hypothetical protein